MKLSPDHPDFTAWLMGELPHDQAAAFEREIAADPAMELVAREQQEFLQQLSQWMGGSQEVLDARQREKIIQAARHRDVPQVVSLPSQRSNRSRGWITLATAALAVVGTWIGWQFPLKNSKVDLTFDEVTREIALLPADAPGFPMDSTARATPSTTSVGGGAPATQQAEMWSRKPDEYMRLVATRLATGPLPSVTELPVQHDRGFVNAAQHSVAPLPLRIGTASWSWVKRSIVEQGRLPHASLIRPEEIIQAFASPLDSQAEWGKLALRAMVLPGETSTDRQLVMLTLHNGENSPQELQWFYRAPVGSRYRLIGFASSSSVSNPQSEMLNAGASVQVMLEVIPMGEIDDLGMMLVRWKGKETAVGVTSVVPSAETKFMRLLFDYCQWLRNPEGDPSSLMTSVSQIENENLTLEQRGALSIMKKSFALKSH